MGGVKVTENYQSFGTVPMGFLILKKGSGAELLLWDPASWADPSEDPEQPGAS